MKAGRLIDSFLEFEKKYKMFGIKINGIHIWHYMRVPVYTDLLNMFEGIEVLAGSGTYTGNASCDDNSLKESLRKKLMCNQFLAHKRDILIFPHRRKYKDEGSYYRCIFTDGIDRTLTQSHYILDRRSVEGVYAEQKSKNILYYDLDAFINAQKLNFPLETIKKVEIDQKIVKPIETYFGVNVGMEARKKWQKMLENYLNKRKYLICYYNYMLKKIRPQLILLVVSYSLEMMVLCETARRKNIPVVELQHGLIGNRTPAYQFYKKMTLPGFPDYIFTFGHFDKEKGRFPIGNERIIPVGYPELEKNYHLCQKQNKKRDKKTILFISQGLPAIAQFANSVAHRLDREKYQVVFQLHPKEYFCWKETIGKYIEDSGIRVTGSYDHTIYESLADADWVVGNYSTVLYEALMFDVKIAILKIALYENMDDLYNNGCALLVDSPEQLIAEIETDTFTINKNMRVFEMNSLHNIQTNIDRIIEKEMLKK